MVKARGKRISLWLPRILAIAFTLFLGLFALDVFGQGYTFWQTIGRLLIHLIPNFVLAAGVIAAWKHPWVGTIFFALLAAAYVLFTGGEEHWSAYVLISLPMLIITALYWWSWRVAKNGK